MSRRGKTRPLIFGGGRGEGGFGAAKGKIDVLFVNHWQRRRLGYPAAASRIPHHLALPDCCRPRLWATRSLHPPQQLQAALLRQQP